MWDRDRGLAYGLTQSGETVTTIKGGRVCNEGGKAEGGRGGEAEVHNPISLSDCHQTACVIRQPVDHHQHSDLASSTVLHNFESGGVPGPPEASEAPTPRSQRCERRPARHLQTERSRAAGLGVGGTYLAHRLRSLAFSASPRRGRTSAHPIPEAAIAGASSAGF